MATTSSVTAFQNWLGLSVKHVIGLRTHNPRRIPALEPTPLSQSKSSPKSPTTTPTTIHPSPAAIMSDGQTKQFGKSQRVVPADKAQKWYPVDDQSQPKKVSTP